MAPKGGGKGGGGGGRGGGSASCSHCTSPLQLYGNDWESTINTAFFAVYIIVALALIASLILQTRFNWVSIRGDVDKRKKRFFYAAGSLLISYILSITDLALHEEEHTTTHLYYLIYIFAQAFWRVAELLILVIIFRTISESSLSNLAQKLSGLHKGIVVIIALVSATAYAFYIAQIVAIMRGSGFTSVVFDGVRYASTAYYGIYLVAALLAGVESLTVLLKARSKATLLMLTVVTPSLILHALVYLISSALSYGRSSRTAQWALAYIGEITYGFIFLGVALIGFLIHRRGARAGEKERGLYVGGSANGQFAGADGGVDQTYSAKRGWKTWGR